MIKFELDTEQQKKLHIWQDECEAKTKDTSCSGGRYTYKFVPTSLGLVTKVHDYYTDTEIDLTDYENW